MEVLHLIDTSRIDPWNPSLGDRQLTVSMVYPARRGSGEPAPYMSLGEARAYVQYDLPPGFGITPEMALEVRTQAFVNAKAAAGKFPLVVLSPGLGNPRATMTSLATDLASRGFVVALVGHPGEDSGEQLADGSVSPCLTCDATTPSAPAMVSGRGVDVKFVVDQLVEGHVWKLSHLIDRNAIGMAGHSLGGAATPAAMEDDPRIRSAVNLDGTFFPSVPAGALDGRAFMLLGNPYNHVPGGDDSWDRTWAGLNGYKRWFTVEGTSHVGFTDIAMLAQEAGVLMPGQTLDAVRSAQITRAYVAAFFEKTLKGCPEPLLDGNSVQYPEASRQG